MSNDTATAAQDSGNTEGELSAEQIAEYLRSHPEFFIDHTDLLADLSLPHESGEAISLLERQVTILRDRGIKTRLKLNNLLQNAHNNDQLFDTTRNLVLALLQASNITEIANVTQDQLSDQANIDACEIIIVDQDKVNVSNDIRTESCDKLQNDFSDVFRLKRTHCGALDEDQIAYLFPSVGAKIRSTAVCPVIGEGNILALIAFGNYTDTYFNFSLDTLFLDFIGQVVGAVLSRELSELEKSTS